MKQDCSNFSHSAARNNRMLKGLRIVSKAELRRKFSDCTVCSSLSEEGNIGVESSSVSSVPTSIDVAKDTASGVELSSACDSQTGGITSWGYVYISHGRVERFLKLLDEIAKDGEIVPRYFVHRTPRKTDYHNNQQKHLNTQEKKSKKKDNKKDRPIPLTISGLVFLQGTTSFLMNFLHKNFPMVYLANDCSTHRPACIPNSQMEPFMELMKAQPYSITLLHDPFEKIVKGKQKIRLLTGPFAGHEGYLVRIKKNRQLVINLGGITMALRGIHQELMEIIEVVDESDTTC